MNCEHLVLEKKDTKRVGVSVDLPRENTLGEIKTDGSGEDPPTRGFVSSNRNPLRMITAKRRGYFQQGQRSGAQKPRAGFSQASQGTELRTENPAAPRAVPLALSRGHMVCVLQISLPATYVSHIALCVWTVLFS